MSEVNQSVRRGRTAPVRPAAGSSAVQARFGRFELDEEKGRLLRDGKVVALAPTPFAVLCALARQPGSLVTKHALLDDIWGHQFVSESVLKTVIRKLRAVLDDDARQPRFIETVSRRGYRFIATEIPLSTASSARAAVAKTSSQQPPSIIGRAGPLARLRRAWDTACGGKRALVWIAGEPGIGKTTLIEEFAASLGEIACARGQCVEHDSGGEPYLPVLEALAQMCRADSAVPDLLRAVAPTWLLQLPWLSTAEERDALRRELAGVRPDRMLREMAEVLDRYTERRALLLVTEDLHWSDGATVQLIDYIARRRTSARLMWLASFRLTEVIALNHPLNRLRHELRLHNLCEEIVLDPFSEQDVADYVAQRSPLHAKEDAFVSALYECTDGVPLFVASAMTDVLTRAAREADATHAVAHCAEVAVPDNLTATIDRYIDKLGSERRMVLSAAAVSGVEFRVSTIADAIEREPLWVGQICEELARELLWLRPPRAEQGSESPERPYSFRHALFRQALYEHTAPAARAQLHRRIGAALERERAAGEAVSEADLAMHFERGGELMSALRYYAQAAERALLDFRSDRCMSLTLRALTLLDRVSDKTERNRLEVALATLRGVAAMQLLGVDLEAKSAFQRAYALLRDVPQHPMSGRLVHGLGFLLCLRAEYAEALAVAEHTQALSAAIHDPVLVLAACIVHAEVHQLQGRWRAARTWAERGVGLVKPLDIAPGEAFVADPQVMLLGLLAIPLLQLGLVEQGRECLQRAHTRARELRQPMTRLVAIWHDALFEVRLGDAQRVAALADEMRALVDEFALAHGQNGYRWFRGWADARMGAPRDAHRRIREAYEQNARLGMLAGGSEVLGYAAEALVLAGDWDAAEEQLKEAMQTAKAHAERVYLPQLFLIQAAIARARGQSGTAHGCVRQALAEARAQEAPWLELMALLELCEHSGAKAEDRHALAALVDQLPEASNTAAVTRARALLSKLKHA